MTSRSNSGDEIRTLLSCVVDTKDISKLLELDIYCCGDVSRLIFLNIASSEERKCAAIEDFLQKHPYASTILFSDDDKYNLRKVEALFRKLSLQGMTCFIYDSSAASSAASSVTKCRVDGPLVAVQTCTIRHFSTYIDTASDR